MKNILIILIIVCSYSRASAQCAIYIGTNGAFGAGYREKGAESMTLEQCKDIALAECKKQGGENCHLMIASGDGGWWGIIVGYNADFKIVSKGVKEAGSEMEAWTTLREGFHKLGGKDLKTPVIKTWWVQEY